MTVPAIKLLQPVADWPVGAVVVVEDRRAKRLIQLGYAEAHVLDETPRLVKEPRKSKAEKD